MEKNTENKRIKQSLCVCALILAACIWYEEGLLMGFLIFIILFLVYAVAFFLCASVIGDKSDSCDIEIHDKKIMEENLKTWNRMNRKFIRKCNREIDKEIEEMSEPKNGRNYYDSSDSILKRIIK